MPPLRKPFRLVLQVMPTMVMLAAQVMRGGRLRLCAHIARAAATRFLKQQGAR